MVKAITRLSLLILGASFAFGQAAEKLAFEVASVKRNTANGPSDMRGPRRSGESVVMHNAQLYSVIFYAYHLNGNYQMVGFTPLPDGWTWYDIEARTATSATDDQVRLMFQSLLEDRFKLKVRRETRDVPEYQLTIAQSKGKPKLAPSKEGPLTVTIEGRSLTQPAGKCGTSLWQEGSHIVCHAADMATIVSQFSGLLAAPVADQTGLTGTYDMNLLYVPDDRQLKPDAPPGPSLAEAIQGDLGLKLEKGKGPVEVLVIDHLEKPSEKGSGESAPL
jgi:uncharacterized protein (TIGR03435 family)